MIAFALIEKKNCLGTSAPHFAPQSGFDNRLHFTNRTESFVGIIHPSLLKQEEAESSPS
jgi:hypothetical protein